MRYKLALILLLLTSFGWAQTVSNKAQHDEISSYTPGSFVWLNDSLRLSMFLRGDSTGIPTHPTGSNANIVFRGRGGIFYQTSAGIRRLDSSATGGTDTIGVHNTLTQRIRDTATVLRALIPDTTAFRITSGYYYVGKGDSGSGINYTTNKRLRDSLAFVAHLADNNKFTATDSFGVDLYMTNPDLATIKYKSGSSGAGRELFIQGDDGARDYNGGDLYLDAGMGYGSGTSGTLRLNGLVSGNVQVPLGAGTVRSSANGILSSSPSDTLHLGDSLWTKVSKRDSASGVNYTTNKRLKDSLATHWTAINSKANKLITRKSDASVRVSTDSVSFDKNNFTLTDSSNGKASVNTIQDIGTAATPLFGSITAANIYGSSASGGTLTLNSTSHATKGKISLSNGTNFNDTVRFGSTGWGRTTYMYVQSSVNSMFSVLYNGTYHTDMGEKSIVAYNNDFTFQTAQNKDIIFQCNGANERFRLYGNGGSKFLGKSMLWDSVQMGCWTGTTFAHWFYPNGTFRIGRNTDDRPVINYNLAGNDDALYIQDSTFVIGAGGNVLNGRWEGSAVGTTYGGTGQSSSSWNGYAKITGGIWSAVTLADTITKFHSFKNISAKDSTTIWYVTDNSYTLIAIHAYRVGGSADTIQCRRVRGGTYVNLLASNYITTTSMSSAGTIQNTDIANGDIIKAEIVGANASAAQEVFVQLTFRKQR